jgi:hypothetical protein
MRCEVADESVVVMKSRPVKAGNSLEGKTGMINKKSSLYVDSRQRMITRGWPARSAPHSLAVYFLMHSIQLKIDR